MIQAGFGNAESIGKLTQRQILLYFEAVQRIRRQERAEALIDMNLAFAGGDAAEKHLKQLSK